MNTRQVVSFWILHDEDVRKAQIVEFFFAQDEDAKEFVEYLEERDRSCIPMMIPIDKWRPRCL